MRKYVLIFLMVSSICSADLRSRYNNAVVGRITLTVAASDTPNKLRNQADFQCDGTSDNVEIQAAIDALPAIGGEVYLTAGTYAMDDTTSPSITMASNVTLRGPSTAILNVPIMTVTDYKVILAATTSNIILDGFTIDGNESSQTGANGAEWHFGVHWTTVTNSVIRNLTVREMGHTTAGSGYGIFITSGSVGNRIESCFLAECVRENIVFFGNSCTDNLVADTISRDCDDRNYVVHLAKRITFDNCTSLNGAMGFNIVGGSNIKITDCLVMNPSGNGIEVETDSGNGSIQVKITDTDVIDAGAIGIRFDEAIESSITDCLVENAGTDGIRFEDASGDQCLDCSVDGSSIFGAAEDAIEAAGATDCTFTNNVIADCGSQGIMINDADTGGDPSLRCLVSGNNITDAGEEGIYAFDGDDTTITNNVVYSSVNDQILAAATSDRVIITNNRVFGTPANKSGITQRGDDGFISGNYLRGSGNIGIELASGGDNNVVTNNDVTGGGTTTIGDSGSGNVVRFNDGWATENGGTSGGITTGQTIAHGLAATPTIVTLVPTSAGVSDINAAVDGTNITVTFAGGGTEAFFWSAQVR